MENKNKHKHLDYLQAAINRMASNLFLLKGWTITLLAAMVALFAKDAHRAHMLLAVFPAAMFWILDGYFLSQERKFRALYEHVRNLPEDKIDYSMDTSAFSSEARNTWIGAMFSRTLLVYYGIIICTLLLTMNFALHGQAAAG